MEHATLALALADITFADSAAASTAAASHSFAATSVLCLAASVLKPDFSSTRVYLGTNVFMCLSVLQKAMSNSNLFRVALVLVVLTAGLLLSSLCGSLVMSALVTGSLASLRIRYISVTHCS